MKATYLISSILFSTVIFSCVKHRDDVAAPKPAALITFNAPTQGGIYTLNDSVSITGTAIAQKVIHGYDIVIKKATDTLYFTHVHDHNDTLLFAKKWKGSVQGTNLEAHLTVYLDHDGNTSTKKVMFQVK